MDIVSMIQIKKNAVSQRINKMGKFFLFYNGEFHYSLKLFLDNIKMLK